jgi:hypothetical protein
MNQVNIGEYEVGSGEEVTVRVVAVQVGEFSTFVVDGQEIDPQPGVSPKTYKFTVTASPGASHFATVSCFFPDDAPDGAKYQIFLSGSQGGGQFTGPEILQAQGPSVDRDLVFDR